MKKLLSLQLVIVMTALLLTGCGTSYDAEESTLFVKKNGSIVETAVEKLDQNYYDEEELKQFVEEELNTYKEENDGEIKEEDFSVNDNTAKLTLSYENSNTYALFNKREFFTGTVVQALAAGYEFNPEFYSVDGESTGKQTEGTENVQVEESTEESTGQEVSKSEVISDPDYFVVILEENVKVQIKGKIIYTSAGVQVEDKNTVVVTGYGDDSVENGLTYIIYK